MSLKDQITEDMKTAMRAKDTARLGTIRLLLSAMKQKEVDERIVLNDAQVVAIIDKLIPSTDHYFVKMVLSLRINNTNINNKNNSGGRINRKERIFVLRKDLRKLTLSGTPSFVSNGP